MDALSGVVGPGATPSHDKADGRVASVRPPQSASVPASAEAGVSAPTDAPAEVPTAGQIAKAVQQLNEDFLKKAQNLYASFEKDKITGMDIVKIVDKQSKEVIRQLPPEEAVAFAQSLELPDGWQRQLLQVTL